VDGESGRRDGESFGVAVIVLSLHLLESQKEVRIDEIINPNHLVVGNRPCTPVAGPSQQKRCWIACRCICCVWLLEPSGEENNDACKWLGVRGIVIAVIVGAGRIVSSEASEQVDFGSGWQGWLLQWRLERGGGRRKGSSWQLL
jgi:hypothetical protein